MRLFLFVFLIPTLASADVVKVTVKGEVRYCFTEAGQKRALECDKTLELELQKSGELGKKLLLKDEEVQLVMNQLSSEKEISTLRLKQYQQEQKEREAAEKRLGAWYRSPFLWFGLGILSTTAVVYAATR